MVEKIVNIIEQNGDNKWSRLYEWIMLIAIAIGVFPLMFRTHYTLFWYFDVISCLCFVVDYILRWITARVRSDNKHWSAFITYPFTPMAIIDLLSSIVSTDVQLKLADPARAGLILPAENEENEDVLMLLMPMLLND